jgi:hypothetical protein
VGTQQLVMLFCLREPEPHMCENSLSLPHYFLIYWNVYKTAQLQIALLELARCEKECQVCISYSARNEDLCVILHKPVLSLFSYLLFWLMQGCALVHKLVPTWQINKGVERGWQKSESSLYNCTIVRHESVSFVSASLHRRWF